MTTVFRTCSNATARQDARPVRDFHTPVRDYRTPVASYTTPSVTRNATPQAARKADTAPAPEPAPKRDEAQERRDRMAAKADEALARIKAMHRTHRKGARR